MRLNPLIQSFIYTSTFYMVDVFSESKKDVIKYCGIFLIILGFLYAFRDIGHADQIEIDRFLMREQEYLVFVEPQYYEKWSDYWFEYNIEKHYEGAQWKYDQAENELQWWKPRADDYEKARLCFISGIGVLAPGTPITKATATILLLFQEYGLSAMERWRETQSLLIESKYNYDMYTFYQEVYKSRTGKYYAFNFYLYGKLQSYIDPNSETVVNPKR